MTKTMIALALALVLCFLTPAGASADSYETSFFKVNMPENWRLLQIEDLENLDIAVFMNKNRTTTVEFVVGGRSKLVPLSLIAECYAGQYGATQPIFFSKDGETASFTYKTFEGQKGSAQILVDEDAFFVVTIGGDQNEGHKFLKHVAPVPPYEKFANVK